MSVTTNAGENDPVEPPPIPSTSGTPVADEPVMGGRARTTVGGRARTIALICLLAASFMELMDATVVNVALHTIADDLQASASAMQWIVAGYPLTYAMGLIVGSRLGDRFGRRRLFIVGLIAFGAASLACGLAPNATALVVFRIVQGLAAAVMVPQVLTNIQVLYPPQERGRAMGMFTSIVGMAAVAGPVLGALITEGDWWGLSWRPIFLINVPIAVLAIAAALSFIPESRAEHPAPITVGCALLLGGSLAAIVAPITFGPDHHWPAGGFVVMACGVIGLFLFGRNQIATERAARVPLVPPSVFAITSFGRGLGAFAAFSLTTGGFFLVQSVHVQIGLGWSILEAGLMWVPFAIVTSVAAGLSASVLAGKLGPTVLQIGGATMAIGVVLMVLAERSTAPGAWLTLALVVAGTGFGLVMGAAGVLVLHDVPVEQAGAASGIFNTTQALSVGLGAAIIGTVYSSVSESSDPAAAYRAALLVMIVLLVVGVAAAQLMPRTRTFAPQR